MQLFSSTANKHGSSAINDLSFVSLFPSFVSRLALGFRRPEHTHVDWRGKGNENEKKAAECVGKRRSCYLPLWTFLSLGLFSPFPFGLFKFHCFKEFPLLPLFLTSLSEVEINEKSLFFCGKSRRRSEREGRGSKSGERGSERDSKVFLQQVESNNSECSACLLATQRP